MTRAAMLLALALDTLGEPPTAVHPVVGMGTYLHRARRGWRGRTPARQLAEGAAGWALGAALAAGAGVAVSRAPWYVQGALLKPLLARKALFDAVQEVGRALERLQGLRVPPLLGEQPAPELAGERQRGDVPGLLGPVDDQAFQQVAGPLHAGQGLGAEAPAVEQPAPEQPAPEQPTQEQPAATDPNAPQG